MKRRANPDKSICVACGGCALQCPRGAMSIYRGCYAIVDHLRCVGCSLCQKACPAGAIVMHLLEEGSDEV